MRLKLQFSPTLLLLMGLIIYWIVPLKCCYYEQRQMLL